MLANFLSGLGAATGQWERWPAHSIPGQPIRAELGRGAGELTRPGLSTELDQADGDQCGPSLVPGAGISGLDGANNLSVLGPDPIRITPLTGGIGFRMVSLYSCPALLIDFQLLIFRQAPCVGRK